MRLSFPLMLLISCTLHIGVVGELLWGHFHPASSVTSSSPSVTATELVLMPGRLSIDTPSISTQPPVASSMHHEAVPVPSVPVSAPEPAPAPPHATIALETNPNAHVRPPQLEAVLSPSPAPQLNNHDGIVFLLDMSGSMYEPYAGANRLTLGRETLRRQILALKDGTPFAITVYGQTSRNSGPLVAASDATRDAAVRFIMQDYDCGGGTNLPGGLASAQRLNAGRLLLVTDGDLNIAPVDLLLETHRLLGAKGQGPALTIIAIDPRVRSKARDVLKGLATQQGGSLLTTQASSPSELLTSAKSPVTMD